ncbi:hypothetical protein Pmani_003314 [Petrolisthes manimaculis]|uniref:Uncharacterized protein n=1 Tax=Petrolisthes manimaculis TaxID=1843537 RepID=A0AAE1QGS6_9EUCA|nr:hypothetical protein Pmani_003314 [Petrolisthes manimaculis]
MRACHWLGGATFSTQSPPPYTAPPDTCWLAPGPPYDTGEVTPILFDPIYIPLHSPHLITLHQATTISLAQKIAYVTVSTASRRPPVVSWCVGRRQGMGRGKEGMKEKARAEA